MELLAAVQERIVGLFLQLSGPPADKALAVYSPINRPIKKPPSMENENYPNFKNRPTGGNAAVLLLTCSRIFYD